MWKDKGLQLVMLPTENKVNLFSDNGGLYTTCNSCLPQTDRSINSSVTGYFLYLLSDEEIKEGNWCFSVRDGFVKCCVNPNPSLEKALEIKKVIASTDPSLNLPQFPSSFLEEYVKRYNSKKSLEIEVKYTGDESENWYNGDITAVKLHVNFNNTISIRFKEEKKPCTHEVVAEAMRIVSKDVRTPKVKYTFDRERMYSRREVEELLDDALNAALQPDDIFFKKYKSN